MVVLGELSFVPGAPVALRRGSLDPVTGLEHAELSAESYTAIRSALGALAELFASLGHEGWRSRPFSGAGLLLIVAVVGGVLDGPGAGGVSLLGAQMLGLAGVLLSTEPRQS
jgi:hypothetical protein